jgi:enterochelin esterase-like enzyme
MRSPRIARLATNPTTSAVDLFWSEAVAAGTPLIEPAGEGTALVTFLWRGEARSTHTQWGINTELTRLAGTDLWYRSVVLPADLRTVYFLQHDDQTAIPADTSGAGPSHIDAANPRRMLFPADPHDPADHDVWASLLELPAAPAEPWTATRPDVPAGQLTDDAVHSTALGGDHRVTVYQPPGAPTDDQPVLVVFDAHAALSVLRVPTVLDNLIGAGRIPPTAAVFLHTTDDRRLHDLTPGPAIERFVCDEMLPWARKAWQVGSSGHNMICGVSRGGLAAAYLGLHRPDVFTAALAQSGSFWWPTPDEGGPGWLIREIPRMSRSGVRFYLDVGTLETGTAVEGTPSMLTANRQMRDALRAHGHPVTYTEFAGGHDYVNWRRTFADGLLAVCGASTPPQRSPAADG